MSAHCQAGFTFGDTGARQYQLTNPGSLSPFEQGFGMRCKAGVGEIDADIDELHGATWSLSAASIADARLSL
ncbi:hypothetical protein PSEUDO8Z_60679 [Pseudomonas sp. 8Z]|nr:hypothetical protein PSEUDO8Z_60679 [Pseudomonas sp. 8Z]